MRSIILALFAALPVINAAVSSPPISKTGRCGSSFGLTCTGSSFGNCCSQYNYCGKTSAHCDAGCQSGFGTCKNSPAPIAASLKVSKDGSCGGKSGSTCLKSVFGNCCSQYGYCGSSNAYCGSGCNPAFGSCSSSSSVSPTTAHPTSTSTRVTATASSPATKPGVQKISTNARCGNAYQASPLGMTCAGSKWGNCCSQYSYCGSTDTYCGSGCQPGFGNCKPASSSPSSTPAKAPVAPSSVLSTMRIPVVPSSASPTSITSSSASSSEPMSTSLTDSITFSSTTIASVEELYTSTLVTSASASATDVGVSSSLEATSASAAVPEIVPASSELPTSLATSEITTSTNPVVSSPSASTSLSESPSSIAELSSTATAPLATSDVASAELDTAFSVASPTVLETSVEPTTTPTQSITDLQMVTSETETISLTATPVISTSPSPESTSSEPTSTTIEESTSSSVIETPSPSPDTPASSSLVSSIAATSTSSAPATCNTLAVNYNPSFESGAITPWITSQIYPAGTFKNEVLSAASAPFAPLDGLSALYTTLTSRTTGGTFQWRYTLQNVYIPAGSNFNCTAGVKVFQGDNRNQAFPITAVLAVDNIVVGNNANGIYRGSAGSLGANDWKRIGGTGVANSQDMHTIIVQFANSFSYTGASLTFALDDLQCFPTGQCAT
ncbi:unnamed protein product [Alternaria burnsii]|nr:unnamed protein product [Alternaria burnsii]